MVITSVKTHKRTIQFKSTQFRYGLIYIAITFVALLLLNIYCSKVSQELFYHSKETSMIEKCKLAANEIANLDAMNTATVSQAVVGFEDLNVNRLIITDQNCFCIYDSAKAYSAFNKSVIFPEIVVAMEGNDVFYWRYHDGAMRSYAAVPIYTYGTLVGCVYMMERDTAQGTLISTLQNSILLITIILEIVVILFSIVFAKAFSKRLRRIMSSIRNVKKGDYTHKVSISGHDELNALGNEFNDLISRLQISEKKRSQFVSDASHELKTPLASIKLLSDSILQNSMDADTMREFVGDIGNEAERLNRMSQKLLALSRADAEPELDLEIVSVTATINRVARMLSALSETNSVQVITQIDKDCTILIHEDDLYQIIFNLVENGIKYNRHGGTLTISLSQQEDNAVIRICDTGVGIPEESLPHIFERFYRVDKARSRSTGGSGLGLSIVRNLAEKNHGTITADSVVGEGTSFTLIFPIFESPEDTL